MSSGSPAARVLVIEDSPTIRKVVLSILTRHGYDAVGATDGQHALSVLAQDPAFDVALVDFVMPKMTGFEFCKRVRADENLQKLPVILMSAKTDKIRDQFVQQTGALDAITKPFDARALVAMIQAALEKIKKGVSVRTPAQEEPAPNSTESPASSPASGKTLSSVLTEELVAQLAKLPAAERSKMVEISKVVSRALASDRVASLLRTHESANGGREVLYGNADAIPLGEIFQVLSMQRQSGVLVVKNKAQEVSILFRDGNIDLAQSKNMSPEFRLGRYFLEEKLVTKEKLENAAREHTQEPLGARLMKQKLISPEQLEVALMKQSSELIYEVCRWQSAQFGFYLDSPLPYPVDAQLGLPPASLVMEGFRRVDEWRQVEEAIDFDCILLRDAAAVAKLGSGKLTTFEKSLLDLVDGERTVSEIVAQSNASSFDACRTLYQFIQSRLVRKRLV